MAQSIVRRPSWLKRPLPGKGEFKKTFEIIKKYKLHTICQEARCPNIGKCWKNKEATFLILGDTCTRYCKFCSTKKGNPKGKVDWEEPSRVAKAIKELELKYVVITSVTRDDLKDGGAEIFAKTVKEIKKISPETKVEVLIPDFLEYLDIVINAKPEVIAHNIEVVKRLTPKIRDRRFNYFRSLEVLKYIKRKSFSIFTKSGFMVGLGETFEEIIDTLYDLKNIGVDIVTIGQYLPPGRNFPPPHRFIPPDEFKFYKKIGEQEIGIKKVIAGPFVRSSFKAFETYKTLTK